eukprot:CAMPEP_0176499690 /NCGR_PEP_ID=MMETSP0200_2-20121128/13074_1 /TAXON_ID=947934 /ORGANISM="Chaetoceros sp., Strain GSL56" /LENGTH=109 /DNA_ID=CAMNT_0017898151 /DNA_START=42 /DNA_END=371 /DNA_ORIENTATION=-
MVLSSQAQRAWKTVTAIVTAGTAFHLVFQVDYGDHDHVFTEVQKWYRKKVDSILLGEIDQKHQQQHQQNTMNLSGEISNSNLKNATLPPSNNVTPSSGSGITTNLKNVR